MAPIKTKVDQDLSGPKKKKLPIHTSDSPESDTIGFPFLGKKLNVTLFGLKATSTNIRYSSRRSGAAMILRVGHPNFMHY